MTQAYGSDFHKSYISASYQLGPVLQFEYEGDCMESLLAALKIILV